jgi:glutamyl-tRNA reductase
MTFRRLYSAPSTRPILSPGDIDALEDIRVEWEQRREGSAPEDGEIIDIALRRLQQDLDSGNSSEVIEDLRREIGYRQWCARAVSAAAV